MPFCAKWRVALDARFSRLASSFSRSGQMKCSNPQRLLWLMSYGLAIKGFIESCGRNK